MGDALTGYQVFMALFDQRSIDQHNDDILEFAFGRIDIGTTPKSFMRRCGKSTKCRSISPRKKQKYNSFSASVASVQCICNNKMEQIAVREGTKLKHMKSRVQCQSQYVLCHRCFGEQTDPNGMVYHCVEKKSIFCHWGYFLCPSCAVKDVHYQYRILDKDGDLLHCCSLKMFTLFRAAQNWVQRLDRFTIQMKVDVFPIDTTTPFDKNFFRHIAWITQDGCYVCGGTMYDLFPYKIIPKWFDCDEEILGYRVLLCSRCRSTWLKHQSPFIHSLCEQHLMKGDEGYQQIYATRNIKQFIDAIKFEYVRRTLGGHTEYIFTTDICVSSGIWGTNA